MTRNKINQPVRRLNLSIPEKTFERLTDLAARTDSASVTEVIRRALALYDAALDEKTQGRRVGSVDAEGRLVTEFISL